MAWNSGLCSTGMRGSTSSVHRSGRLCLAQPLCGALANHCWGLCAISKVSQFCLSPPSVCVGKGPGPPTAVQELPSMELPCISLLSSSECFLLWVSFVWSLNVRL